MDEKERFNRKDISKILKIAAELDHQANLDTGEETLTREELHRVAAEAGIDPLHLQSAIEQFKEESKYGESPDTKSPFVFTETRMVPYGMSDDLWDDVVTEIRRVNGGIGKTDKLGKTFEWEQRKKDMGYLQVSITPRDDHTRIRINSSYTYYSFITQFIGGCIGFSLAIIIGDEFFSGYMPEWLFGLGGALISVGMARVYARNWMKKKRLIFKKLMNRVIATLSGSGKALSLKDDIRPPSEKRINDPLSRSDDTSREKANQSSPGNRTRT